MTLQSASSIPDPIEIEWPAAFEPLCYPKRYKAAYGGRGGAKSHFFAEQLVLKCYASETRAVCIREIQKTLKESVRQLIIDKIEKLGFGQWFDVLESEIRGSNGSLIIFVGMQSYNAESIKSLEGFDVAWVEEAQSLSLRSLRMLRPTLRKDGSELWFSWNPRFESDPVDEFFRGIKPPNKDRAAIINVNWADNPWFPQVLREEKAADYDKDPEVAEHIWGGAYQNIAEGAYYAKLISQAEKDSRITTVPYDGATLVTTAWDLGADDSTAIWFCQVVGLQVRVLDYYENNTQPLAHYASLIKSKPYNYGDHILPHDAGHKRLGKERNESMSDQLRALGIPNRVLPVADREAGIEKVRQFLPKCWFDRDKCHKGLKALRNYRREYDDDRLVFKQNPMHDWASDGADAFRYLATGIKEITKYKPIEYPDKGRGIV